MINILIPSFFLAFFGVFNFFGIRPNLLSHQLFFILVATVAYLTIKKIGRNFFQINNRFFYIVLILVLVLTYIIGLEVKGSKRWIDFYFFNFQGSEFLKIFFILFLANFFSKKTSAFNSLHYFLLSLLCFLIPFLIIFKQPDLGNAMVYTVIYFSMLLFSSLPKEYFIKVILICLFILPLVWLILKPYQKERVVSFIQPTIDEKGITYNMKQAIITSGSGKFWGRGLGLGTQSRLFFLPENTTDFAFSSLIEQFGFVGGFFAILFYFAIIYSLIKKMIDLYYIRDNEENFLYVVGFLSYFVFQVFVNIGMNLGLLPIAGVALPFISYGGSAVVALMMGVALLP